MMAGILRAVFLVVVFFRLLEPSQAQVQVPDKCDPVAQFKLEEPLIVDSMHREALRLLGEIPGQSEGNKQQQNEFGRRFAEHIANVGKRGAPPSHVAIMHWSLGELMARSGPPDVQRMGADFRGQALKLLLRFASTRQEIDQLAYFAFNRDARGIADLSRPKVDAADQHLILKKHIEAFGANRRQMELWDRLRAIVPDIAREETLFAEQIAAADRSGDQRTRFDAKSLYFEWLFQKNRKSKLIKKIINEIHEEAAVRIAKYIDGPIKNGDLYNIPECDFIDRNIAAHLSHVVLGSEFDSGYKNIREVALRLLPVSIGYGTDPTGMIQNSSQFLASRFIDKRAQSEGYSYIVESGCPLPIGSTARAICSAIEMAATAASIGAHSTARVILDDALALMEKNDLSTDLISIDALAEIASFHWKHGDAHRVPELLDRADQLVMRLTSAPKTLSLIDLKALRAEIANSEMQYDVALRHFGELIDYAGRLMAAEKSSDQSYSKDGAHSINVNNMERLKISRFWTFPSSKEERLTTISFIINKIDTLVERTLRRTFCAGCTDDVHRLAAQWLEMNDLKRSAISYQGSANDYLLSLRFPNNALSERTLSTVKSGFQKSLTAGDGKEMPFSIALDLLRKESGRRQLEYLELRHLAIHRAIFGHSEIQKCRLDFLNMKMNSSISNIRNNKNCSDKLVFSGINEEAGNWFSAEVIDDSARKLLYAGYTWPSRELFKELVRYGVDENEIKNSKKATYFEISESRILSPAHARLAAFAEEAKDWPLLNQHLDRARLITLNRLEREWDVGNDRAGILLREFRGAVRLIAQLRLRAAANPAAKAYQSKLLAAGLEDLQLAMLGDTALTALASQKRRITTDPKLKGLIDERGNLRSELGALEALKWAVDTLDPRIYGREKEKLAPRLAEVEAEIKRLLPVPEDLTTPNPTPLLELQRYLQPKEGVLILHAGSDGLYGILVGKSGEPKSWVSKITLKDLESRIATVRQGIEITGNRLPLFKFAESAELLDLLLGPAKDEAFALDSLNVVADGPLQSLPLGILPMRKPATEPVTADEFRSSGTQWFALGPVLRHLTSVKALHARERTSLATKSDKPFFGIGNPTLKGVAKGMAMAGVPRSLTKSVVTDLEALRNLTALPDTEVQLSAMAQAMGPEQSTLMLGDAATERGIKSMKLDQYKVVTFATHGLVAGEFQGLSEPGLVLTPPQVASAEDDGVLTSSEISQLKFGADLVILSACNTAASDGRPGAEGLSGLARAFMGAGARSLVVSHWAIPSGPTVDIMKALVANSGQGPAPDWAKALRTATKAAIETMGPPEMAHPANWGAFVVYGQN